MGDRRDPVIVSAVRTPVGSFGGSYTGVSALDLGCLVIREAVARAGVEPVQVDEVIMGNVLQAGLGQNPARLAALRAGLPEETPAMSINKVCGSGLKSVSLAAQAIRCEDADTVVAGGMENMSQAPYLLHKARYGYRMGDDKIIDSMLHDGLVDQGLHIHMGETAENLAEERDVTREEMDEFSLSSQQKAAQAIESGVFDEEIVAVDVMQGRGKESVRFDKDEHPRSTTLEKLATLKPAFRRDGGRVTAGNASGINNGAAATVVMSAERAEALGLTPLARIVSFASAGVAPRVMGIGPVPATERALAKAGLSIEQIDLIEANEAFAAQCLAVGRALKFDMSKVNIHGGAIALGHPIGASGARILVTLLHSMKAQGARYGLATLCIGGGQGIAMIVERPQ